MQGYGYENKRPGGEESARQLDEAVKNDDGENGGAEERERDIADADALWEDLEEGHRQKRPKWEAAAEAWRRKTHLGAAQASMGLKATNLGPFEQARLAATQDEERARKKMHPKRPDGSPNVEFYDDAGLYKAWLRDYASRSGSRKGGSATVLQQRSSGGGVSRGSKGRGLRFEDVSLDANVFGKGRAYVCDHRDAAFGVVAGERAPDAADCVAAA